MMLRVPVTNTNANTAPEPDSLSLAIRAAAQSEFINPTEEPDEEPPELPGTVAEFKKLFGREPGTDAELEFYYGPEDEIPESGPRELSPEERKAKRGGPPRRDAPKDDWMEYYKTLNKSQPTVGAKDPSLKEDNIEDRMKEYGKTQRRGRRR